MLMVAGINEHHHVKANTVAKGWDNQMNDALPKRIRMGPSTWVKHVDLCKCKWFVDGKIFCAD